MRTRILDPKRWDYTSSADVVLDQNERMNHEGKVFETLIIDELATDGTLDIVGIVESSEISETHLMYLIQSTSEIGLKVYRDVVFPDKTTT